MGEETGGITAPVEFTRLPKYKCGGNHTVFVKVFPGLAFASEPSNRSVALNGFTIAYKGFIKSEEHTGCSNHGRDPLMTCSSTNGSLVSSIDVPKAHAGDARGRTTKVHRLIPLTIRVQVGISLYGLSDFHERSNVNEATYGRPQTHVIRAVGPFGELLPHMINIKF